MASIQQDDGLKPKSTKFNMFNMRFEQERLNTYINWPLDWLSAEELAREGFYFLRTKDHVACFSCKGIVGHWETGDIPKQEHKKHFSHCKFINNVAVGNVSIKHGNILARLSTNQTHPEPQEYDVCGFQTLNDLGLPQYTGPKYKNYITEEERLKSFIETLDSGDWPDRISQTPSEFAEAGFFWQGVSDHVRCFHCGNGLRNWENGAIPWNEHAIWYPECNYVIMKKGQDFIDSVRVPLSPIQETHNITDDDLEALMDLDIINEVAKMGFPKDAIKTAHKNHIKEKGTTYSTSAACIDEVLRILEEANRVLEEDVVEQPVSEPPIEEQPVSEPPIEEQHVSEPPFEEQSVSESPIEDIIIVNPLVDKEPIVVPQEYISIPLSTEEKTHECRVCMDVEIDTVFLPCRHMLTCHSCAVKLTQCPVCRIDINHMFKPIMS